MSVDLVFAEHRHVAAAIQDQQLMANQHGLTTFQFGFASRTKVTSE
jgi:hypothetical protein